MPLASVSSSLTTLVGDHGLYAVFALMAIDAVFPAASELVMLYAGALAAGAFAGQHVSLLGSRIGSGFGAYLAMALAGALGYLLGASWEHLHERFRYADYAVAALVVAGIAVLVWKLARRGRGVSESGPGYTRESE